MTARTTQIPDLTHRLVSVFDGQYDDINLTDNLQACCERIIGIAYGLNEATGQRDGTVDIAVRKGTESIWMEAQDCMEILNAWWKANHPKPVNDDESTVDTLEDVKAKAKIMADAGYHETEKVLERLLAPEQAALTNEGLLFVDKQLLDLEMIFDLMRNIPGDANPVDQICQLGFLIEKGDYAWQSARARLGEH